MLVGVTGGNGFVGRAIVKHCTTIGIPTRSLVRSTSHSEMSVAVGDITVASEDWQNALSNISVLVHCAAITSAKNTGPLSDNSYLYKVNVLGTLKLAQLAAAAGVRRLIFISSIKVNGEATLPGKPFSATDEPRPADPYGESKHLAEVGLKRIAEKTGLEVVIIRPPLIYGEGVAGNFASIISLVRMGWPLPLASIRNNARSFVSLSNLLSVIEVCFTHNEASGKIFMVSDDEDLSTAHLLTRIGAASNCPVKLFRFPPPILHIIGKLLRKEDIVSKLTGNLQVDISNTKTLLGWQPVQTVQMGLETMFKSINHD